MPNPTWFFFKGTNKEKKEENEVDTHYTAGMSYIYENLIGSHAMVQSPFGPKRMTYADYTASGRSLHMIENYISKYVLSYYGNTHTSTSFASMQTTKYREEAKSIIRRSVNASIDDAVIFVGSGATGAIHKLIGVLGLSEPTVARSSVVIIGPYEHHSNILPWQESGAKMVRIEEDRKGLLDIEHLERELKQLSASGQWKMVVGTFSACSNVTGLLVDTVEVTQLMHLYGGLVFWDYAAGAPYLKIDMNPRATSGSHESAYKDGLFCSPHKFVGGPGSPGLLIAKKKLFTNSVPHGTGGGTVLYVSKRKHSYTNDVEAREEGGTPGIIESIRAGLVFHLKASVGLENIHKREMYLARKGINQLHGNPNIILLGSKISPRVPILSFAIRYPASKKLLHHNFVALLLNDLFGIQARGGCACAGPYAQDLLGIAEEVAEGIMAFLDVNKRRDTLISTNSGQYERMDKQVSISNAMGIMKPGFIRLNLAYFMPDEEVEFILSAVNIIANEGWKLLPQYSYDIVNGNWIHRSSKNVNKLMSLDDIIYNYGGEFHMVVKGNINPRGEPGKRQTFPDIMKKARRTLASAETTGRDLFPFDELTMRDFLPADLLRYVWWLEPQYAMRTLNSQSTKSLAQMRAASIPLKPRVESGPVEYNISNKYPKFVTDAFPGRVSPSLPNPAVQMPHSVHLEHVNNDHPSTSLSTQIPTVAVNDTVADTGEKPGLVEKYLPTTLRLDSKKESKKQLVKEGAKEHRQKKENKGKRDNKHETKQKKRDNPK